jgi:4Fe-4S binding domain
MQPSTDAWAFPPDEADVVSWSTLLRDQGLDLAVFAAFAVLVLVSFHRKSTGLRYLTLALSVIYLGFYKSQLLSIVNVFSLFTWSLPVFKYSLAWYGFAGFAVVTTVLWGRLYCGRICAFGALTQLIDRVVPSRWRLELPPALERRAANIKYAILSPPSCISSPRAMPRSTATSSRSGCSAARRRRACGSDLACYWPQRCSCGICIAVFFVRLAPRSGCSRR